MCVARRSPGVGMVFDHSMAKSATNLTPTRVIFGNYTSQCMLTSSKVCEIGTWEENVFLKRYTGEDLF